MAIGRKNNKVPKGYTLLVLRLMNKLTDEKTGKEIPLVPNMFQISEKIEDKWTKRPKLEANVSGDLVDIEFGKGEFEGNEYLTVKLYLQDDSEKEVYLVDLRYTYLSRNLYNSMLSLKAFSNVSLSNYKTTSKKDGKDYSNLSLWQGDALVKGKYKTEEIPKAEEVVDKKGVVQKRIFGEVDAWFEAELRPIAEQVKAATKVKTAQVVTTPAATSTDEELPTPEDDQKEPF